MTWMRSRRCTPASSIRSAARAAPPGCSSSGRTTRTGWSTASATCHRSRTARRSTSCARADMPVWSRLDLGVGLIAAGGVDLLWPDIADLVQVVEVEPQTLWDHADRDGRSIRTEALSWLRSLQRPLLSHGVGFPVGGTTPPDADGVRASARSARDLDAVHWSEHLSFN